MALNMDGTALKDAAPSDTKRTQWYKLTVSKQPVNILEKKLFAAAAAAAAAAVAAATAAWVAITELVII